MMKDTSRMAKTYVLYRFFDKNGTLLYIGKTSNPGNRIMQHDAKKPWWKEVSTITLQHFDVSLEQAEIDAIKLEQPKYNVSSNGLTNKVKKSRFASRSDLSLLEAIRLAPKQTFSRTDILNFFSRNLSVNEIDDVIEQLMATGKIMHERRQNGPGRPADLYKYVTPERIS